jgi:glucosamine kinase
VPKFYLGVDGGGTNCRIRLADEAMVTLGEVTNGRGNLQLENGDPAYQAIIDASHYLFVGAGLDPALQAQTYACFGMAGARLISARDAFAARSWPFAAVEVYDDIDIARAGAHLGDDGAVIIIGTGSAGLALVDGNRHQVGGWGFHVGDQMSGAILGRELARWTVEVGDGMRAGSPLTEAALARLGGDNNAIMDFSFKAKPADYGALIPLFFEYFERGDPVALALMDIELRSVDVYVDYFRRHNVRSLAAVGGFGRRLYPQLTARYGSFIVEPRGEPLDGAIILARQLFGTA